MIKDILPEIDFIKNKSIRLRVYRFIDFKCPSYFWTIPASSSGKYHPEYCLGLGGLVRHTKAAVKIAIELFEDYNFTQRDKDIIISSLIVHDMFKQGTSENQEKSPKTIHSHPALCADAFLGFCLKEHNDNIDAVSKWERQIFNCVASHMGKWNTSKYDSVILAKPKNKLEKFVHLCDYLASRKCIEVKL